MPSPRGWQRLGRIAHEAKPATAPYHVDHADPRRGHPAPGWYWRPPGARAGEPPEYLGFNNVLAEIRLLDLLAAPA